MNTYSNWLKEKSIFNLPRWTQLFYYSFLSLSRADFLGILFGAPLSYIAFYPYFRLLKWKQDQIDAIEKSNK